MNGWLIVVLSVASACVHSDAHQCSDGRVCPAESTCNVEVHTCVTDEQLRACEGRSDGAECDASDLRGACHAGICLIDDADADGLPSVDDNCPTAGNPDQADSDVDGFGDACDFCPQLVTANNHDEDDDGVGDQCDLCPQILDFQVDSDGDHASDPCDQGSEVVTLLAFEPFVDLGGWSSTSVPWHSDGDSIAPDALLDTTAQWLRDSTIRLASTYRLRIEVGFTAQHPWTTGDRLGVALLDDAGSLIGSCEVNCHPGLGCRLEATFSDGSVKFISAPSTIFESRLHVMVERAGDGINYNIVPEIDGYNIFPTFTGPLTGLAGTAAVSASPKIRMRYYAAWSAVR